MFLLRTQPNAVWKVKNYLPLPNFDVIFGGPVPLFFNFRSRLLPFVSNFEQTPS